MREILKKWWQGTYVPARPRTIAIGTYKLHWSSKVVHIIADFWMKHWQWCFYASFSIIGLTIAAMKL